MHLWVNSDRQIVSSIRTKVLPRNLLLNKRGATNKSLSTSVRVQQVNKNKDACAQESLNEAQLRFSAPECPREFRTRLRNQTVSQ